MSLKSLRKSLIPFAFLLVLAGCERQGPLERFGEEVDEAVEDVRNGGETVGNRIDDAVDDVRDGVNDAVDELEKE